MSNAAEKLVVPALGESVTEATVSTWLKQVGDSVEEDETIVELETDKVTMEVNAPTSGVLKEIKAAEGATVEVGDLLGYVEAGAVAAPVKAPAKEEKPKEEEKSEEKPKDEEDSKPEEEPKPESKPQAANQEAPLSPAVRRMVSENDLDPSSIPATGKNGRITKEDVMAVMSGAVQKTAAAPAGKDQDPREERVAMTRLRQTVAKRLKDAQNNAAILTTFNEVDMSAVMDLRNRTKEQFEKKHGVKLGFMSFFVKACVEGLKEIPAVNAEIQGTDILYKNHYDVSVAIGAPQGLVVPVIRDADRKAFWEIEQDIADYAAKAKDGKLTMEDMSGGTFTVSNGGVFGSLLSTPILNPPQSGILGMHKTEMRAVVVDGKVEVRPMMYLALSYDHRIIDGKEAVTFLVRVKECIENPDRMLLNV